MRVYLSHLAKELLFWGTVIVLALLCIVLVLFIQGKLSAPEPLQLASTSTGTQMIFTRSFPDVDGATPMGKAITDLVGKGIINGFEDGTFHPEKEVTRVEALKMIFSISDVEKNDIHDLYQLYIKQHQEYETVIFSDIPKNAWFAPYIFKGYRLGMISGNQDGTFNAAQPVNVAEVLKMLLVMEREQFTDEDGKTSPFPDVQAEQWFTRFFNRGKQIGLLPFEENKSIYPLEIMTRGKLALLLEKYISLRSKNSQDLNRGNILPREQDGKAYLQEEIKR